MDLGEFLQAIAEGKKAKLEKSPGQRALKSLEENLHATNPFIKPTLVEKAQPDPVVVQEEVLAEVVVPEVKPASQIHSQAEIDKYVTSSTMKGNPWLGSDLEVTTEDGETQKWRTQMIINQSKYGKLFNQFPSRLKKS